MASAKMALVLAVCLAAAMIQTLNADPAVYDPVWQKRAEEAKKNTMNAYIPDVMEVSNDKNAGDTTVVVESAAGQAPLAAVAGGAATSPAPAVAEPTGDKKVSGN
ncbi:unnamed protein product [Linum tenue]|uniref:Pectate lyase N-terminal domain-containing protein n=2 Tax=Linum TaxID=4005 RepID=A0AAV2CMK5_9ROSI|nr:unnamed protein product [Linum tenue]